LRFELIDRVTHQDADRLVAVKAVTNAEEYLGDHFPGFAVLPGVMMLETLVQAGRLLLGSRGVGTGVLPPLVVSEVRNVRYGNMVRPGQTLRVEVTLRKPQADANGAWDLEGTGIVLDPAEPVTAENAAENTTEKIVEKIVEKSVAVQGRFKLVPLA
jgi:3-hydroxyacyl-[acyl-carrier-protein] dehydratase